MANNKTSSNAAGEQVRAFVPSALPPQPPLALTNGRQRLLERATLALGRPDSGTGSRQRAKSDDIASIPVAAPPQEFMIHYAVLASRMHTRIHESINVSRTLAALRDTLLPKLISGELRVAEAERMEGSAV
jgi:hypothetical protein